MCGDGRWKGKNIDSRDQYSSRRDDTESRYDRYRGNFRAAQPYSTYRSPSPEFGRYADSSRAEDFPDRERDNYHVRPVVGGLKTAVAELTKQVGGLTQEVRGLKNLTQEVRGIKPRLDSIDTRLAKVEAWEGRLDAVEQQLQERARSPARRRSPSPGSKCFACGGEGHYRSECPRPPTVTFEDQIRCWGCGERGHSNASCPRSRSHSSSLRIRETREN